MAENKPIITIIVAVLNSKESLERCIESVNNQTYPHRELIIIDGGSTDGTVEILKNNDDKIAYWESKPDRGIYHAFNKAIKYAQGEWIYFLGSDDYLWTSDVLEKVAQNIRTIHDRIIALSKRQVLSGIKIKSIFQGCRLITRRSFITLQYLKTMVCMMRSTK